MYQYGRWLSAIVLCFIAACGNDNAVQSCQVATDCGQDSECVAYSCTAGRCSPEFAAAGGVLITQTPGDCHELRCDGVGGIASVAADDPAIDQNPCTIETCTAGAPTMTFAPVNTACGTGLSCDGVGHCVQCASASECPGSDDDCQTRTCSSSGVCGFSYAAQGTPRTAQTAGDCQRSVCDGAGGATSIADNADSPADDGNVCTSDVCTNGAPSHPALAAGTTCGAGLECDGDGACVDCLSAADCPASSNECEAAACSSSGTCGFAPRPTGTALATQTTGDCKQAVCDGSGGTTTMNNDGDLPADDGNACTTEACLQGNPVYENVPAGTSCGNGLLCDGDGACVQCLSAANCPTSANECEAPACTAGFCGFTSLPAGTSLATQTPGDCQQNVCDGDGGTTMMPNDSDVPADDGNPCTQSACHQGTPAQDFLPTGTSCGTGMFCDGFGSCL